jgi:hypothetical protein
MQYTDWQRGCQGRSGKVRSSLKMSLNRVKQKADMHLFLVLSNLVILQLLEIWMEPIK